MTVNGSVRSDGPTLAALMGEVAAGARELVTAHAEQLQTEIRHEASQAQSAGTQMAGGVVLAAVGALFLLVAAVMALIEVLLWPAWAAWFSVGALIAAGGLTCWVIGRRRWSLVNFPPEHTLNSIRESMTCLVNSPK